MFGVKYNMTNMLFTQEQNDFLKSHYPSRGSVYCSNALGLTKMQIVSRANYLGLKVIKITNNSKTCGSCKQTKDISQFNKRSDSPIGLSSQCKDCIKIRHDAHYEKNKKEVLLRTRNYYQLNKDLYRRNYQRNYHSNPTFKLRHNIARRILLALKEQGADKNKNTVKLLGCSIKEYKDYLEKKFLTNMTWENHGDWHIDHIKPCASFDLSNPDEQKVCFHYTNTQPLWKKDNLSKGKKFISPDTSDVSTVRHCQST